MKRNRGGHTPDRSLRRIRRPHVVITGGAGFIGSNLARRLLKEGHRVVLLDSLSREGVHHNWRWLAKQFGGRVTLLQKDVRDPDAVRAAIDGAAHVFHFAAQVAVTTSLLAPVEDFEVNARGTLNVLEAVRAQRKPPTLLMTSTNKVYGALDDVRLAESGGRYVPVDPVVAQHGVDERRPLDFHSPYGCSKGAADQYVVDYARTFGLHAVVFRMSCIYGQRQFGTEDQGWVAHFLLKAMRDQPITIFGDGKQVRDVLYVDDLVEALMLSMTAAEQLAGRAFNVGGGTFNTLSLLELLEHIEALERRRPAIRFDTWRRADQRYYVSDCRRLEEATGWRAKTSVEQGIERLRSWLSEAVRHDSLQRALVS